jgi:putative ATP-binding cassette transporter
MLLDSALIKFIQQESSDELKKMLVYSGLVGISTTGLLALINNAAADVSAGRPITWQYFIFIFAVLFFAVVIRKSNKENIVSTQLAMHKFKMRIMAQVLRSDLSKIDEIGRPWILQALVRDTQTVSQAVLTLVTTCQSASVLFFMTLYLAVESLTAFFVVFVASCLIFIFMTKSLMVANKKVANAWHEEGLSFDIFSDFLNGFKEIKMNSRRAQSMSEEMVYSSRRTQELKSDAMIAMVNSSNNTQVCFYIVIGITVFIVPILSPGFSEHVIASTTTIMFLVGSLGGVVAGIPNISQANASAQELFTVENRLKNVKATTEEGGTSYGEVHSLSLEKVCYQYGNEKPEEGSFSLGPISYRFTSSNIYFIRGNNGSGKSTLMRILVGLYQPSGGEILVNDKKISQPASSSYRDLFAVVFSDFYLFKKLYGIYRASDDEIESAVHLLKMQEKIAINNGIISTVNLSTGQRKRIALIVALLEKTQFIVLDEWASDQDPEFRKYFYETILPGLRDAGKTIIAITHDDQYYNLADHVLVVDRGRLAAL